jgi:hypothetical protein
MNDTLDRRVRAIARVGVLAVLLLGLAALVIARTPNLRTRILEVTTGRSTYVVGELVDLPGVAKSAPFTVVVFARASCRACEDALPLLKAVRETLELRADGRMLLLYRSERRLESEQVYGAALGLTEAEIHFANPPNRRLRALPAIMVIDVSGRIRYLHEGRVSPQTIEALELVLVQRVRSDE